MGPLRTAWLHALVVGLVASAVVCVVGPGDVGHNDSATYLDGALHLARGEGFVTNRTALLSTEPLPITLWPPGFSAAMVPGIWLGLSTAQSAGWVLGACHVLGALCLFLATLRLGTPRSLGLGWLVSLTFILQPHVLGSAESVMSDLPFTALVLAALLVSLHITRRARPSPWWHALLGALLGCSVLVRYVGLFVAPCVLLGTWLGLRRPRGRWHGLSSMAPGVLVFAALAGAWPVRNARLGGQPMGRRGLAPNEVGAQLDEAMAGLGLWVDDVTEPLGHAALEHGAQAVLGAGLALGLWTLLRRRRFRQAGPRTLLVVLASYAALLVLAASLHDFDSLKHSRFWLPAWPLAALLLADAILAARHGPRLCRLEPIASAPSVKVFALR